MTPFLRKGAGSAALAMLLVGVLGLAACGEASHVGDEHDHEAGEEAAEGAHGGRLVHDGEFALEWVLDEETSTVTLYPFDHGNPIPAADVAVSATVTRLGGEVTVLEFAVAGDGLKSDAVIEEPHSFDVAITATFENVTHQLAFGAYEGRTTITPEAAADAGIAVLAAGPATIRETVDLTGRVMLVPGGRAEVHAWYAGRIVALPAGIGDRVKRGDPIATIEARDSLRTYTIPAPMNGIVMERALNVGDLADATPIAVIGDPSAVQAELHVFPRDADRIVPGQPVHLRSLSGSMRADSRIEAFLPLTEPATQTLTARAILPNADEKWRAGLAIEGDVTVAVSEAAVGVKLTAIQRMDGETVVFVNAGDVYEARPVDLGRTDGEWAEITGGLSAGETYVSENAFLIRADIEKSGAAHEH